MRYRTLGPDGLAVSIVGIGTWVTGGENWGPVDDRQSLLALDQALAEGINLIDTAPSYGSGHSERLVAKAIKGKRDRVLIATKCGLRKSGNRHEISLKPADIRNDLEGSLTRLRVETVDLYQCHWPDPHTPIEDTMGELIRLQHEGKIRYIGVSNFDQHLLQRALAVAPVISLQAQYSILERSIEKSVLPFCRDVGLGVMAYGALAGGVLSGKYTEPPAFKKNDARSFFYRYYREPQWGHVAAVIEQLSAIARERNKPTAQVALNWVIRQHGVTSAVVGLRSPAQAAVITGAATWELTAEEHQDIEAVYQQYRAAAGTL